MIFKSFNAVLKLETDNRKIYVKFSNKKFLLIIYKIGQEIFFIFFLQIQIITICEKNIFIYLSSFHQICYSFFVVFTIFAIMLQDKVLHEKKNRLRRAIDNS